MTRTQLVQRLRERGSEGLDLSPGDPLCAEAANEIERLVEQVRLYRAAEQDKATQIPPLQAEIARLRGLLHRGED